MASDTINLETWTLSYEKSTDKKEDNSSSGKAPSIGSPDSSSTGPLTIEKPNLDMVLHPPKSTLRKVVFNPNSQSAQFYNVVEDLAQAPCMMSSDSSSLQNQSQSYGKLIDKKGDNSSSGKTPSTGSLESSSTIPLTIEKPNLDMILCPPKSTHRKFVFNPNSQAV